MEKYEVRELLRKLKQLVKLDRYTTVYRKNRKRSINRGMLKAVVANLTIEEFNKRELDKDGSGEFVYVFITHKNEDSFYIKFKFINENEVEIVKFISFHP